MVHIKSGRNRPTTRILFLCSILIINIFASCDYINPDEKIPSYLGVDTFLLNTVSYSQGPQNHNISDVWATVNGEFIGVFEMPAEFPVLQTGPSSITYMAGIKKNGIAASRVKYPFYSSYQVDTVLYENDLLVLKPVVKYKDETVFDWFENFEDAGISIDSTSLSDAGLIDTSANGSDVVKIELYGEMQDFEAESIERYEFPEASTPLYFEMDYWCDHEFIMGLKIYQPGGLVKQPVILINPIESWNKIYIDLTYLSTINSSADNYAVYFAISRQDSLNKAQVMLDNLKLLHF